MANQKNKARRNDELLKAVGVNIRCYRKQKNLSMEQLAVLTNMELKQIYNYEYGKVNIDISMLSVIAEALGIEANLLLIVKSS